MKTKKEIAFHFQEIPLEEARPLFAIGVGRYSQLLESIAAKLPYVSPGNAFIFGLGNHKELDKVAVAHLLQRVTSVLNKLDLPWAVKYSSPRRVFICIPSERNTPLTARTRNHGRPAGRSGPPGIKRPMSAQELYVLAEKVLSGYMLADIRKAFCVVGSQFLHIPYKEIAKVLGISRGGAYFTATYKSERSAVAIEILRKEVEERIGDQK